MPDWFEALNKDFRYHLTVIGTFAQAMVAEKIRENRFKIKTSAERESLMAGDGHPARRNR